MDGDRIASNQFLTNSHSKLKTFSTSNRNRMNGSLNSVPVSKHVSLPSERKNQYYK